MRKFFTVVFVVGLLVPVFVRAIEDPLSPSPDDQGRQSPTLQPVLESTSGPTRKTYLGSFLLGATAGGLAGHKLSGGKKIPTFLSAIGGGVGASLLPALWYRSRNKAIQQQGEMITL